MREDAPEITGPHPGGGCASLEVSDTAISELVRLAAQLYFMSHPDELASVTASSMSMAGWFDRVEREARIAMDLEIEPGAEWVNPWEPHPLLPEWTRPPKTQRHPGTIYFVWAPSTGQVKIGYTSRPVAKRIAELQRASGLVLELVASEPGTHAEEQELHRRFDADRVSGEWFTPTQGLWDYIKNVDPF